MTEYHFNEDKYLKEFTDYVESTYSKNHHYVGKGGVQATDLIISADHGAGFCIGNIIKYASRYGKKAGQDRKDLMKVLHYALIMIHIHDEKNKDEEYIVPDLTEKELEEAEKEVDNYPFDSGDYNVNYDPWKELPPHTDRGGGMFTTYTLTKKGNE